MTADGPDTAPRAGAAEAAAADAAGSPAQLPWPSSLAIRSAAMTGSFLLLLAIVLHQAAALLVPVVLAIFVSLLLTPIVVRFEQIGIPRTAGALLVLSALASLLVAAGNYLSDPAVEWAERAPRLVEDVRAKLSPLREPVEQIGRVAEQVEDLTALDASGRDAPVQVTAEPGVVQSIMRELPVLAGSAVIMMFLTFFLLASGPTSMRKLAQMGRTFSERRRIVLIAAGIRQEVTSYLVTVTLVNLGLGIAVAAVMQLIGVPNAPLWGALAMLANYAPYVGPAFMTLLLAVVGLLTQASLPAALIVPAAYFVLTLFEGQLLTPLVLGHRLNISPVIVFVSVLFWGYMWGVAGAVVAVPIAAAIKIASSHFAGGRALSILMGR
ncbi:MAG: AI-2E family transporter [Pseudomonadota bacterium]